MAIVICRPDKPPPPTQDRISQRVFLKYEPVPASPHQGGHVKARSELNYDTCEPKRELVARENYKRRKAHLQAGFHGPCEKSYREVGEVVLNNRKLFQDALGQDGGRSLSVSWCYISCYHTNDLVKRAPFVAASNRSRIWGIKKASIISWKTAVKSKSKYYIFKHKLVYFLNRLQHNFQSNWFHWKNS